MVVVDAGGVRVGGVGGADEGGPLVADELFRVPNGEESALLTGMLAALSSRGQIVIPQTVRDRCRLGAGDHFAVDDDPDRQTVTLRKVQAPWQWFEVYLACPHSFELPLRRKEFYRSKQGLAD